MTAPAHRPVPDATVVTGASGWLGRALLHALADEQGPWHRSTHITALVRTPGEANELAELASHIQPVVGDVTDPASLANLFDGLAGDVDVIHTAGLIHPRTVRELFDVNVGGTRAVLDAASRAGVRRVVHVSSNSPFGTNPHPGDHFRNDEPYDPYLGYGRSKMEAELAVLEAVADGLDAVIVRPPWFYGPYQPPRQTTFFAMVRGGNFPVIGAGDQARSMVYVDNLVQGVLRAELSPHAAGSAWWIADARPYQVIEIVETVGRALADEGFDVRPNRLRLPELAARAAESADRAIQRLGRYQQQLHVLGEMRHSIAVDISAARRELGYEPEIDLYQGMRRSVRWCVREGLLR
ncbi:MAG: NAD(P)-dependent oxidoreductase [Ilumatobacter sp.]|uniref:NAD-dependent epimerase/dehydratase family protein n=1 Tax=Ilumatobacter sp. TaxID=1967498 RepID=UPI00260F3825|nr:NAD(P)-dependent oxidoreductase [Ilumatobacter sp.]MDJ0767311.1 NAD(P)-dependent oxidoreductase [Ilumatobacter sp.]